MPDSDPKRKFATDVVQKLNDAGHHALWAGGCVRDFLLGKEPQDYDVATDAHPDQVRAIFGKKRTVPVGASFGVILIPGPKSAGNVEVATFRTEGDYLDGRRPDSVEFTTAEQDAWRRDFTINGMFYDPIEHAVIDYVGGEEDLGKGIIRAIGEPHDRMREDKLRLLRAVRFAANLEFQLDPATFSAVSDMAPEILDVSAERIAQELKKMLVNQHRPRALELARETGLLPVIFPELQISAEPGEVWQRALHRLQLLQNPGFELAAATLFADLEKTETVESICKRLKLSNQETDHIGWLHKNQSKLADAPSLSLAQFKRTLAHRWIADLLQLMRVDILSRNDDLTSVLFCEDYLKTTPAEVINPDVLLTGHDLLDLGIERGPKFKTLLNAVRDAQLNGEIETKQQAVELAQRLQSE